MRDLIQKFIGGRKGARAIGVLLLAWSIFLALSLVSHSYRDFPNSSRSPVEIVNWAGYLGAWISYTAFTAIGYSAYGFPVLFLLWGWNRMRGVSLQTAAYRTAGIVSMMLLFSVGSVLPEYSSYTAFKLGGWFGTQVTNLILVPYAGRVGSAILLAALLLAAVITTTDLDFRRGLILLQVAGRIGRWPLTGLAALRARLRDYWARRRHRREERRKLREERRRETSAALDSQKSVGVATQSVADESAEEEVVVAAVRDRPESTVTVSGNGSKKPAKRAKTSERAPLEPDSEPAVEAPPQGVASPDAPAGTGRKSSGRYKLPALELLDTSPDDQGGVDEQALQENARMLEEALANFDVNGKVVEVSPGPVVTRYEVEPAPGVKVNRIVTLSDDLARVMSANGIRIQAPVPGKSVVGVEIANETHQTVYLSEILESKAFKSPKSHLTVALGKTISGEPYTADLGKMPHLLVAGATGSGKSVCVNSIISSILFKSTPDQVRLLMVDPKVVELTMYNDIPHLLTPVITEPKKASEALKWTVAEMELRYQKLAKLGVRNLVDYNAKVKKLNPADYEDGLEPPQALPYIVALVDEFADLMLTAPADVETSIMSLAQKSRAVGIHLILATQRPSVNVITGVIKANFPSRIAFQVASKTDSRTILDVNGAERLLGRGDMLFLPSGQGEPVRIHGAFVSGEETEKLVREIVSSGYEAAPVAVLPDHSDISPLEEERDELFGEATQLVIEFQQASTSFLQRRMKVGYSRAARLMDELEAAGIVGPADGAKPREIYVEAEELDPKAMAESNG